MTKAVILAGGRGRRLEPYTTVIPKPLMPLGDRPILDVVIRQLKRDGITDLVLTVGHLADLIIAYFGDGSKYGVSIRYSERETIPLGTAGPLSLVTGLDSAFLVLNGDLLTTLSFRRLLDYHRQRAAAATVALFKHDLQVNYGVVETNGQNLVTGWNEKPTLHYMASMGIYVFEPSVLKFIPQGQYFDVPSLIAALLAASEPVAAYPFSGYWRDIGQPDDYQRGIEDFEAMRGQFLAGEESSGSDQPPV